MLLMSRCAVKPLCSRAALVHVCCDTLLQRGCTRHCQVTRTIRRLSVGHLHVAAGAKMLYGFDVLISNAAAGVFQQV